MMPMWAEILLIAMVAVGMLALVASALLPVYERWRRNRDLCPRCNGVGFTSGDVVHQVKHTPNNPKSWRRAKCGGCGGRGRIRRIRRRVEV